MIVDARNFVDYASDAAFAIDGNMNIVAWNYAARRLLGYTRREVLGRRCSDVLRAVFADGQKLCVPDCEGIQCFRRSRTFAVPSCRALGKDGGWVSVSIASVVTPSRARSSHARSAVAAVFLHAEDNQQPRPRAGRRLKISTLGRFALATAGQGLAVEKWHRKQALTLLKFLVVHLGHAVHREVLIEQLWPQVDESHGRERLKVTVYFLRQQLRAAGIEEEVVETVGKAYVLRRDAVWVDADVFEKLVADGIALQRRQRWDEALQCYEEAQRLYRGDYMEEDIYADWCALQREKLREIDLGMLAGMAECYAEGARYAEAAQVCRIALDCDPYRESFHRALMTHLVRLGHADSAVAQYRHCESILAAELGVEPVPETQRLYRQILDREAGRRIEKLSAVTAVNAPIAELPSQIAVGSKSAE